MFKRKKDIIYSLAGNEGIAITREQLANYSQRSLFWVSEISDNNVRIVLPIDQYNMHEAINRLNFGLFMYLEQLEEFLFSNT